MDSASLKLQIKKFFRFGFGDFWGDVTSGGVFAFFWPTLPGPGHQPDQPYF